MKKENRKKLILGGIVFYGCLIGAWQLVYYLGTHVFEFWKPYAFPDLLGMGESLGNLLKENDLWLAIGCSLLRSLGGFALSCVVGFALGYLTIRFSCCERYLKPLLNGLQSLPSVCWVPFAILWFGIGNGSIIFVVVMGSAFSIALSVDHSIRSVDPLYINAAKTMGASGRKLWEWVVIPAAMPALVAGLRQGWSFAWRALMSGEVIAASIGLGYTLMMGRNMSDINQVMLVIIIIIIIGMVMDRVFFSNIEKRILKKQGYL